MNLAIKNDLVNQINNKKYYEDVNFKQLLENNQIKYEDKINMLVESLEKIVLLNTALQTIPHYIPDTNQNLSQQQSQGQSHIE